MTTQSLDIPVFLAYTSSGGYGISDRFTNSSKYGHQGSERENELSENDYYTHFRGLDDDIARWKQVDPKMEMQMSWSPYASMNCNPILNTDILGDRANPPDDITLNAKGEVSKVVETDKPNRFFDDKGTELKLNDPEAADSPMLTRQFDVGDKVFEPISRVESTRVLGATKSLDFNDVKLPGDAEFTLYLAKYAANSYGRYDYGYNYLQKRLNASDNDMLDLYKGTGYVYEVPFVKFEGKNTLYNLPDAGNFLWGKKAADNHLPPFLMLKGAAANEGGADTSPDTRAIIDGYND